MNITKRGKLTFVIIAAFLVLAAGLVYGFRHQLGISADTGSSTVTVTVKKSGTVQPGYSVSYSGASGSSTSLGFTNTSGVATGTVPYGTYNFSAGFPPDCGGIKNNVVVSSPTKSLQIDVTCGGATATPTPRPSATSTRTSPPSSQSGHIRVFVRNEGGSTTYGQNGAIVHFKQTSGTETTCTTSYENGYPGYCSSQNFARNTSLDVWVTYSGKTSIHQTAVVSNVGPPSNPGVFNITAILPTTAATPTPVPTPTRTPTPTATSTGTVVVQATSFDFELTVLSHHLNGTAKVNNGPVSGVTASVKKNGTLLTGLSASDSSGKIVGSLPYDQAATYTVELSGPGGYDYSLSDMIGSDFSGGKIIFTKSLMTSIAGSNPARMKYAKQVSLRKPQNFNLELKVVDQDNRPISGVKGKLKIRNTTQYGEGTSSTSGNLYGFYSYAIDYNNPPASYTVEFSKPGSTDYNYSAGNLTFTNADMVPGTQGRMKYEKTVKLFAPMRNFFIAGKITYGTPESFIPDIKVELIKSCPGQPVAVIATENSTASPTSFNGGDGVGRIDINVKTQKFPYNSACVYSLKITSAKPYLVKNEDYSATAVLDLSKPNYSPQGYYLPFKIDLNLDGGVNVEVSDESGAKIESATVTLSRRECDGTLPFTRWTDANGIATYNEPETSVMFFAYTRCIWPLQISVSKAGYTARILTIPSFKRDSDSMYATYIGLDGKVKYRYYKVVLKGEPAGASGFNISGRVVDDEDKPIESARVHYCPKSAFCSVSEEKKTTTDANGNYSFRLETTNLLRDNPTYVIWAQKEGYSALEKSMLHGDLTIDVGGKAVLVNDLILGKYSYPELEKEFGLWVVDQSTHLGIKDKVVFFDEVDDAGGIISRGESAPTDTIGMGKIVLKIGSKYKIYVTSTNGRGGTKVIEKEIEVPANYNYLSEEDIAQFNRNFILEYPNTSVVPDKTISITVVEKGSSRPVANTVVQSNYLGFLDGMNLGLPESIELGVSDRNGVLNIKLDEFLDKTDVLNLPVVVDKRYTIDGSRSEIAFNFLTQAIVISGQASGFIEGRKNLTQNDLMDGENIRLELAKGDQNRGIGIQVYNLAGTVEPYDIKISKKDGSGNWQVLENGIEDYSNTPSFYGIGMIQGKFYVDKGKYKVDIKKDGILVTESKEVEFSGFGFEWLTINFCNANNGENHQVKSYENGVKFTLFGDDVITFYENNKDIFQKMADKVSYLKTSSIDIGNTNIFVSNKETKYLNALSIGATKCFGGAEEQTLYILLSELKSAQSPEGMNSLNGTIIHEYGHSVYDTMYGSRFDASWIEIFNQLVRNRAMGSGPGNCVFKKIQDGILSKEKSSFGGHPWDNPHEMFASYYFDYYNAHELLLMTIIDGWRDTPECSNTMAFMWQLFSENVGEVSPADGMLFGSRNDEIGNTVYSFSNITSGVWRESTYAALAPMKKVQFQFELLLNTVESNIATLASQFNDFYDSVLRSLGIYRETGNVAIRINDINGKPISGLLVKLGGKVATESSGEVGVYKVTGIQTGSRNIETIQDTRTKDIYSVRTGRSIVVTSAGGSSFQNLTTTVSYPPVRVSVRVFDATDKPVANVRVKLIGDGSDVLNSTTNSTGSVTIGGLRSRSYQVEVYRNTAKLTVQPASSVFVPDLTKPLVNGARDQNLAIKLQ